MIDFKSEVKGVWVYFDGDNQDLGGVCIKETTSAESDDIRRLTVTAGKPDYHRGQRYETEQTNKKLQLKMIWRKLIVDWKGVSLDGQKLECNDKNKEKMMTVRDFQIFVGGYVEKANEGNKTIEAARVKNSGTSPSGDSKSPASSVVKPA